MSEQERIGLYGGSFDPIHHGHLSLALELKRAARLDRVLFCPANISPFKQDNPPKASGKARLEMCQIALEEIEGLEVCDFEVLEESVSYTINTAKKLKNLYPKAKLFLLLTVDAHQTFSDWKDYNELKEILSPIAGSGRESKEESFPGFQCYKTPIMEISSTRIREKIASKSREYLGHLAPLKVLDYIFKHQLYL